MFTKVTDYIKDTYDQSTRAEAFALIAIALMLVVDIFWWDFFDIILDGVILVLVIWYIRDRITVDWDANDKN